MLLHQPFEQFPDSCAPFCCGDLQLQVQVLPDIDRQPDIPGRRSSG
jgi:hypothetical protein